MPAPLTVRALVAAPAARTWELYTSPEHVTGWNSAHPSWHSPSASSDLRVGGRFNYRMEARDGSGGFDFEGTWTRVEAPAALDYTMDDGRTVQCRFQPVDGGTEVVVVFEPEGSNPLELQQGGWQAILDNFARYVAAAG